MSPSDRHGTALGVFLSLCALVGLAVGLQAVVAVELPRPTSLLGIEPLPREGLGLVWTPHASWPADVQLAAIDRLIGVLSALVAAAVGIAALNTLTLLTEAGSARRREIAVRAAVGAEPWRLVRDLLLELRTLGAGALVLGVAVGVGAGAVARATWPGGGLVDVSLGDAVGRLIPSLAAFALLAAWAHAALSLRVAGGGALADELRAGARSTADLVGVFTRRVAAVAHMAIAGAVLVSAVALTVRPDAAAGVPDEASETVVVAATAPSPGSWSTLLEELRGLPGVHAESLAAPGALVGLGVRDYVTAQCGQCMLGTLPMPLWGAYADHHAVGPGFFELMGLELLAGRAFTPADGPDAEPVAIVNEVFARVAFEGGNPLGKKVKIGKGLGSWVTVVGVVETTRAAVPGRDELAREAIYLSALQRTPRSGALLLRGGAHGLDAVLEEMAALGFAAGEPLSLARYRAGLAEPLAWLGAAVAAVALLALLLAVHGVHATALQVTRRRTPELAVRRALGATDRRVLWLVVAERVRLGLWGTAGMVFFGTLAVALLRRAAGVPAPATATITLIAAALVGVSVAGSLASVREALSVEPAASLE